MVDVITMLSPRQTFADNIRPAHLLLQVYSLLDCNDQILDQGDMVDALRQVIRASAAEDLMVVYNELFLGLVRERANMPKSTLRHYTLCHLLRQAVVASCTALETYLPALLRANLPVIIQARGREFIPRNDNSIGEFFPNLAFSLDDVLRLINAPDPEEFISGKIMAAANAKYLSNRNGIHVTGVMLGLGKPWDEIAAHLKRDKKELMGTLEETVRRRNDIVHRADRAQSDPGGDAQDIGYAWTKQAIDTVEHICLALDELVARRVSELRTLAAS